MTAMQKTLTNGSRKALVTRLSANRWAVARGYTGQIKVERYSGDQVSVWPQRWMAVEVAKQWVSGQ